MRRSVVCIMALVGLLVFASAPAEANYHAANPCAANPCAANPCAAKAANPCAANPCAAKNPCAANPCNPCAAKGAARGPISVRTVWGQVVSASPSAQTLVLKSDGKDLTVQVTKRTEIKLAAQRMERASLSSLKPGDRVAVSFLDQQGNRQAAYIYVAQAAANPCGANPCAAKNPCAANPCAAKGANPCAAKNPCAGKNPCAANPCAVKK